MSAPRRQGEAIAPSASPVTVAFLDQSPAAMPPVTVPRDDRDAYVEQLDTVCRELAEHLVTRYGLAGR